jgi:hypothetical protein
MGMTAEARRGIFPTCLPRSVRPRLTGFTEPDLAHGTRTASLSNPRRPRDHGLPALREVRVYSPRVREGFPIAAPVTWKQVARRIRADAFTMSQPFRRIEK